MTAANSERVDAKTKAIEDALSRIGEPISEAKAKELAARGGLRLQGRDVRAGGDAARHCSAVRAWSPRSG